MEEPIKKQTIKEVFKEELEESAKVLIRKIISPASLGIVILAWAILSMGISIYVRQQGLCQSPRVELGYYLKSRLLCEVKEN